MGCGPACKCPLTGHPSSLALSVPPPAGHHLQDHIKTQTTYPPRPCLGRAAPSPAVPTCPHLCSAGDTVTRSPVSCLKPVPPHLPGAPSWAPRPQPAPRLAARNTPTLPTSAGVRPGLSAAPLCPLPPLPSSWSSLAALPLWPHTPLGSWSPPAWPLLLQLFSPPPPLHMQVEGGWGGTVTGR